jgi:hypothetical protein
MKPLLLAVFVSILRAAGPAAGQEWSIRVEVFVVGTSVADGLRLVPRLRNDSTRAQAVGELQDMTANAKAALLGAPVLWTTDGDKALSESIEEFRSAGQWAPSWGLFSSTSVHLENETAINVPTAMETRNVGMTLEVEPQVSVGGELIAMSVTYHRVSVREWQHPRPVGQKPGDEIITQPQFRTLRITEFRDFTSGEWSLLGMFVLHEPAPAMELVLLRATAIAISP